MKTAASFLSALSILMNLGGCSTATPRASIINSARIIPFTYIEKTFIVVPVTINDSMTENFILDTGIGLSLISKSLCEKLHCTVAGTHRGKRMSGQEITVPTSRVAALSLGNYTVHELPVGIFDIESLIPGTKISGFLSLGFFKDQAFTIDYKSQALLLEDKASLMKEKSSGVTTPITLDKQGDSLGAFLPLTLPDGQTISVEVDTGSQALILDERLMAPLGVHPDSNTVKRRDGKDETGHEFSRYFTKLRGTVHLPRSIEVGVKSPDVMFQKIIYDGLVGQDFLSRFLVTFNLPQGEMIFTLP